MTRILIVDDEPSIRQAVSTLLRLEGYEVDTAPDGVVALKKLHAAPPDVVISDVQMPQMGGIELLAAVRALPALDHVRFLILAGLDEGGMATEKALALADACIKKPFSRLQLLAALRAFGY